MLSDVIEYFKDIYTSFTKDNTLRAVSQLATALSSDVIPALTMLDSNSNLEVIKRSVLLTNINKLAKLGAKDNVELISILLERFKIYEKKCQDLEELVESNLANYTANTGTSLKDITILKVIEDISDLTLYTLDIIDYILLNGGDSNNYPAAKIKYIKEGVYPYVKLLDYYTREKLTSIIKIIPKLSDKTVDVVNNKKSMVMTLFGKTSSDVENLPINGFIGNPIYHIRIYMVDKEIAKYKILKDKKKLIELRILELKAKEQSAPIEEKSRLETAIEYHTKMLLEQERSLEKVEKKYGG